MPGNDLHQNGIILGEGSIATLGTAETDLLLVTDLNKTKPSQLELMITALGLGTHTSIELRYYTLPSFGSTNWIERVKQNSSDNTLDDFPAIIDGSTPNSGKISYDLPMPACTGFKVTAKGVGGANGSLTGRLMGRYN